MSSTGTGDGKVSMDPMDGLQEVNADLDFVAVAEEKGFKCVPEAAFVHVEQSLDSGVRDNMVVEMPLSDDGKANDGKRGTRFWLAKIVSMHGPLLRLQLIGNENSNDIWCDLSKQRLYPLGWCQMNKIALEPPQKVKDACPEWQNLAIHYLEDIRIDTISMHHIEGEGVTPVDRLKEGMMMELQDYLNPNHFWPVSIVANNGGLLMLKYEGMAATRRIRLFYTSDRLFPLHHARKSGKCYSHPTELQDVVMCTRFRVLKAIEGDVLAAPSDLISPFIPGNHNFVENQLLEVIPPGSTKVELAVVDKVWDNHYFQVRIVANDESQPLKQQTVLLCHKASANIFPVGFSSKLSPAISKYSATQIKDHSTVAPDAHFPEVTEHQDLKDCFVTGHKLEVLLQSTMRCATVCRYEFNILQLELDNDAVVTEKLLVTIPSTVIFPFGWSITNSMQCLWPRSYCPQEASNREEEETTRVPTDNEMTIQESSNISSWCPPIFFNYQCYSTSFLSKARLASLPKSVGPGRVSLVMKKVLQLIIGSSYKSGSILKRLECKSEQARRDFIIERLKGKSRVVNLKGNIEIPTLASQVEQYCREVCQKVGACPHLVSTTLYSDKCPADCQRKPKSAFLLEDPKANCYRYGRKKRKRRYIDGQNGNAGKNEVSDDGSTSSDSEETPTEPSSIVNSRSASPESEVLTNDTGRKKHTRKEWENILPRSEMQTRGAKLPNFKLHLKIRPTKEEQSAIAKNSLRESIGYDRQPLKRMRCATSTEAKSVLPEFNIVDLSRLTHEPSSIQADDGRTRNEMDSQAQGLCDQPPPIRKIHLRSDPRRWTYVDTARFLAQTTDCAHLAHFMMEDEIDGISFMLLNYATAKTFWSLTTATTIRLCQHVESVKLACFEQFEPRLCPA